jgi:hypothetical protein
MSRPGVGRLHPTEMQMRSSPLVKAGKEPD